MEYILENPNSGTGRVEQVGDGLWKLSLSFGEAILPEPVKLHFRLPCVDVYSVWYTHFHRRKNLAPGYDKIHAPARFASGAPVMAFVSLSGQNRMALALSEVRRETEITFGILEETGEVDGVISFFPHKTERMAEYTCLIREDVRDIRYEDALRGVERWWESLGDAGAAVPLTARLPMYSTWYNFHQNFKEEDLIAECTIAKRMGMDTILLDDGWQTGDNNRGYAYCGDWEVYPGKIPDMRRFTDRIHDLGMKVIVWYSVPFVGKYSKSYETYRGFYLNDDGRTAICLDPRYPHIRAHLVELYAKAVEDFNLDGLKLDFIDSFCMTESALVPDARRDTESLEEALDLLLKDVTEALCSTRPDFMIEFRQSYIGPAVRHYGNMLRVGDCPDDPVTNRCNVVDLRLLSGNSAVHSDMLMWHPKEQTAQAAVAVLSCMFGVCQMSVMLREQKKETLDMMAYLLGFMRRHRQTLQQSPLYAENQEANYTYVRACGAGETVGVVYAPYPAPVAEGKYYLFNATGVDGLVVTDGANRLYTVYDCTGRKLEEGMLTAGATAVPVPLGGHLTVE